MRELTLEDIEALAVGAWILGTGGGSPYRGLLDMRRLYAEGYRVPLLSPFGLANEDWVAVVSNMGGAARWPGAARRQPQHQPALSRSNRTCSVRSFAP
jgi:DUF917 family protein